MVRDPLLEASRTGRRFAWSTDELASVITKHPGKAGHDQKTHGRKFSGEVSAMTPSDIDTLDMMLDVMGVVDQDFAKDPGVKFTQNAMADADELDATVFVARVDGEGVAGAISIIDSYEFTGDSAAEGTLYVSYLGSTGIATGAGTALVREAARHAASQGKALTGNPTPDALPFWEKMGWKPDPLDNGAEVFGWTVEDTKRFASA